MSVPNRLIRNKSDEVAVSQGCYFDPEQPERVRYFFRRFLRHSKGQWAGKPFELLDWQWRDVVEPLFGWRAPDGTRRFRRVGIAVAKKNGKSTLLSGLGLYLLTADNEPGAEVYSAAADRNQASIIYNEAAAMVNASDALAKRLQVRPTGRIIRHPERNAWYQALSADVPTKEGLNIHGLLFDELHSQATDKLWNTLRYGGAARRQPLIFWISTAGVDRFSICYRQWQASLAVQESRAVDVALLPVIYAAKEEEDWTTEQAFAAANPSYGITLSKRDWEESVEEAKQSPQQENAYRRYRLNQWTAQLTRWIQMIRWDDCKAAISLDDFKGKDCIVGLDLATTTDLAAACLLFREEGKYSAFPHFWLPESALGKRERENLMRLDHWAHSGLITLTPGDVIDYAVIREQINQWSEHYNVKEVAIDPWNATQIATDLQGDGFEVVYVRTGFASISAATKEFEKIVLAKTIQHAGHEVLDWNVNNIAVATDPSGNLKPDKNRSAEKIDGAVSLILALARYIVQAKPKRSKYNDKGLDSI